MAKRNLQHFVDWITDDQKQILFNFLLGNAQKQRLMLSILSEDNLNDKCCAAVKHLHVLHFIEV